MRLGQHLGTPVPVEYEGKTWLVGPITLNEFAEFQEYLLRKPLEEAAKFSVEHPECRDVMMREAMQTCKEMRKEAGDSQDFGNLVAALQDIGNLRELLFICIKKNHAEVTRKEASDAVNLSNMTDVLVSVMEASGLDGGAQDPTNLEPKKESG